MGVIAEEAENTQKHCIPLTDCRTLKAHAVYALTNVILTRYSKSTFIL